MRVCQHDERYRVDAILLDVEKDISKSFNAVLGATIAVCIVFFVPICKFWQRSYTNHWRE